MWPEAARSLDDRIHPMLVKEARQHVRGRVFAAVLNGVVAAQLVILGWRLLVHRGGEGDWFAGQIAFLLLSLVVLSGSVLIVPLCAAARLNAEYADGRLELLTITPMGRRSILWGKVLVSLMLVVLIFAASAPFMLLTYLLRGIDIPTILAVLAIDFFAAALSIPFALSMACLERHGIGRVVTAAVTMGFLLIGFLFLVMLHAAVIFMPLGWGLGVTAVLGFWLVIAVAVVAALFAAALERFGRVNLRRSRRAGTTPRPAASAPQGIGPTPASGSASGPPSGPPSGGDRTPSSGAAAHASTGLHA